MNNYHLFLIRSDQATQIVGHLLAGVITLALIFSMAGTGAGPVPGEAPAQLGASPAGMPAGTEMIAAHE